RRWGSARAAAGTSSSATTPRAGWPPTWASWPTPRRPASCRQSRRCLDEPRRNHPGRGDGRRAGDAAHQAVHPRPGRGRGIAALLRRQPRNRRPAPPAPHLPPPPLPLTGGRRGAGRSRIAARGHGDGRGGSLYLHSQVGVGTRLDVSYPVNLFPLARLGRKHVLVAGGVGITPMTAMIDDLRGGPVPWELHYVVRGPEHDHFGRQLLAGGGLVHLYYGSAGLDLAPVLPRPPLG